jgi:hypothetical protein
MNFSCVEGGIGMTESRGDISALPMNNRKAPEFIPVCKGFADREIPPELSRSNRPFKPLCHLFVV